MRYPLFAMLLASIIAASTGTAGQQPRDGSTTTNPLIAEWSGPSGGAPPWDQVRPELFPDAFEAALAQHRAEIDAIAGNVEPPTFENTIAALDGAGMTLDRVARLFAVMTDNMSTPAYQQIDREWQPRIAAHGDAIVFNQPLFARVAAVYKGLDQGTLTREQHRLTTRTYESTWTVLESRADLGGLTEATVEAARAAAEERGLSRKWVVVNTRSSVDPFLSFSTRRDLREQVWRTCKSRGDNGDENDTKAVISRIVRLRAERARLLGYETHAHWRMDDTMAGDPRAARALMMQVWPAAVARVREEVADMQAIAAQDGDRITIEPWDYLFYQEKVRKARYDLDTAEVEPYFQSDQMIQAAMWAAGRLYDLSFTEITGKVPVFHPDVRVWEVTDTDGGATAITSNNNNFLPGSPGEPALISRDDAETMFHEFGHSLHALLQDITYPGLAATPRDFVEYPSQVNEQWLMTSDVLDRFARHHETGEPIPAALLKRIEDSDTFNQGYATVEYLAAAILDMDLHTIPDGQVDPAAFEREGLQRIGMPREIALRHRLPHFNHLFGSDAYSAGYYSYLWSDVMAADTWQAFLEDGGPWDRRVADRLRAYILSEGNTRDRAEAYRLFRGRDPEVRALLAERGFPTR